MSGTILVGDCRAVLAGLPEASVNAVITSPPYYSLRAYNTPPQVWGRPACLDGGAHEWREVASRRGGGGEREYGSYDGRVGRGPAPSLPSSAVCTVCARAWRGELGLEPSPSCAEPWGDCCGVCYAGHMVEVFRAVRRVLHPSGTVWCNLAGSYSGGGGYSPDAPSNQSGDRPNAGRSHEFTSAKRRATDGYKPKDFINVPHIIGEALRRDGWWLRSIVPWVKTGNAMPESVTDRPGTAVEYWLLLSRAASYFWDADAVRKPHADTPHARGTRGPGDALRDTRTRTDTQWGDLPTFHNPAGRAFRNSDLYRPSLDDAIAATRAHLAHLERARERGGPLCDEAGVLLALDVNPTAYSGSHYATYSPRIVAPLIQGSTSEAGVCSECLAPWVREVAREIPPPSVFTNARRPDSPLVRSSVTADGRGSGQKYQNWLNEHPPRTTGWRPSCPHDAPTRPAIVLDPFGGSGATGAAAESLGRDWLLVELSEEYAALARARTAQAGFGSLLGEKRETSKEETGEQVSLWGEAAD